MQRTTLSTRLREAKDLQYAVREAFGVPMSITAKWLGRASTALLLYSGYSSLKAAQDKYKACMAE
jgi:hypothetical protein